MPPRSAALRQGSISARRSGSVRGSPGSPRPGSEQRRDSAAARAARVARKRSVATLDVEKIAASVTAKQLHKNAHHDRHGKSAIRRYCRRLVYNPWFERVSLVVIVLNCITLSMEDPTDKDCVNVRCKIAKRAEYAFIAIFTVEMAIKLTGLGIYKMEDAYLRSSWNVLDGIIVIAGLLQALQPLLGLEGAGMTGLLALRLLRPLKAVRSMPSVQVIVMSILACLPQLFNVCLLYFFFVFTMGIIAVQQWKGVLLNHCVDGNGVIDPDDDRVCRPLSSYTIFGGHYCSWGYTCKPHGNPYHGKLHFDNIAAAMLTLYTAISLEGWSVSMYFTMDASTDFASVFWVVLVVIGAFFILSLTIVVITEAFDANSAIAKTALKEALEQTVRERKSWWTLRYEAWADCLSAAYQQVASAIASTQSEWLRAKAQDLCGDLYFQRAIIGFIFLNTVQMAVQHHDQPGWLTEIDDCANTFWCVSNGFTIIFGLEVLLKIYGDGLTEFWSDGFNRFDLFVVLTGIAEMIGDILPISPSVLRTFRVLRILKLAQRFPGLRRWTIIIIRSMKEASVLTVLMLMMLFIAALLGMQFFGGKFCGLDAEASSGVGGQAHCSGLPRANYDSLHLALITSFQILSGEDWNLVMFDGMRGGGDWLCLYFVFYHTVASYMILNLFIAVLLNNRNEEETDAAQMDDSEVLKNLPQSPRRTAATFDTQMLGDLLVEHGVPQRVVQMLVIAEMDGRSFMRFDEATLQRIGVNEDHWQRRLMRERHNFIEDPEGWQSYSADPLVAKVEAEIAARLDEILVEFAKGLPGEGADLVAAASDSAEEKIQLYESMVEQWDTWGDAEQTFGFLRTWVEACLTSDDEVSSDEDVGFPWRYCPPCFDDPCPCYPPPDHPCRSTLLQVCEHPVLEGTVLVAICASTVTLAVDDPLTPPDHFQAQFLRTCDVVLTCVFWGELLLKSAAYGFFGPVTTYLRRDAWNRLDCFIVVVSTMALTVPGLSSLSVFKVLRTLRPLRFIHRVQGMKTAVQGLLRSLPAMANIVAISSLILLIFSILGMQLFAGTSYRCSRVSWGDVTEEPMRGLRSECLKVPGNRWEASRSNFDHLGKAALALFEVASLEGWVALMHTSVDGVSYTQGPMYEHSPVRAYYFVLFIIIGSFFMVNMFIGVLIDAYTTEKESAGGMGMFLTNHQKEWIRAHKNLRSFLSPKGPAKPKDEFPHWRRWLHGVVTHSNFDNVITVCIILNIVVMAMEHHGASYEFEQVMEDVNFGFVSIFAIEAVLKILALGRKEYFGDPWNRFDLIIVVLSATPLLIQLGFALAGGSTAAGNASLASQFRMLRLARLLRMVKQAAGVRALLRTLFYALPSFSNIAGLILLVFFVFAVMGLNLFGKVDGSEEMNHYANFRNILNAFLLLIRLSTGEGWQAIMGDCMAQEPYCDPRLDGCVDVWVGAAFFTTFTMVCMYVLLNLFVAVILDGSSEASLDFQPEDWDMDRVEEVWSQMCVPHLKALPESSLENFLRAIGPPLGPPQNCTGRQYRRFLLPLDLRARGGYLLQRELFPKLFDAAFGADLPGEKGKELRGKVDALIERDPVASPTWGRTKDLGEPVPVNTVMEVVLVQAHIRGWLEAHRRRKLREQLMELEPPDATPDSLLCIRCPAALARIPLDVASRFPHAKLTCQLCGRYAAVSEDSWAYCPSCVHLGQMHEVCQSCLPEEEEDIDRMDRPPLPLQQRDGQPPPLSPRRGRSRARTMHESAPNMERAGERRGSQSPSSRKGSLLPALELPDFDVVVSPGPLILIGGRRLDGGGEVQAGGPVPFEQSCASAGQATLPASRNEVPELAASMCAASRRGRAQTQVLDVAEGEKLAEIVQYWSAAKDGSALVAAATKRPVYSGAGGAGAASAPAPKKPSSRAPSPEQPGGESPPASVKARQARRRRAPPATRPAATHLSEVAPSLYLQIGISGNRCGEEALAAARAMAAQEVGKRGPRQVASALPPTMIAAMHKSTEPAADPDTDVPPSPPAAIDRTAGTNSGLPISVALQPRTDLPVTARLM
eukprot:TRINITY_DN3159_c1_g1_i1.p1 TRINITY_DN3159_c1_g1~~TRINITY_DN3159_c1_g1_i1.p1  ORF type:complete len:2044 (+),score=574.83 TRINITY_DN3159_c1_g1_i1:49-6180(+)